MNLERRLRDSLGEAGRLFDGETAPEFTPPPPPRPRVGALGAILVIGVLGMFVLFRTWPEPPPTAGDSTTTSPNGPTSTGAGTTVPEIPPEFVPPTVPEYDAGVATSIKTSGDVTDIMELYEGLTSLMHQDEEGPQVPPNEMVEFNIDRCQLVGPDQWLYSGTITVPGGGPVSILFDLIPASPARGVVWNDLIGMSTPIRLELSGSGRFTVHYDGLKARNVDDDFHWGWDPAFPSDQPDTDPSCRFWLTHASAPARIPPDAVDTPEPVEVGINIWSTPLEVLDQPMTWTAPADSIQGLGIGARLDDAYDPRISWAALAWAVRGPGSDTVWVPTDPLLSFATYSRNGACEFFYMWSESVTVTLTRRCTQEWNLGSSPPSAGSLPDVEGFTPVMWNGSPGILTERDGWTIVIGPRTDTEAPPDLEAVAAAANSLTRMGNLVVEDRQVPGADPDLDRAIASAMTRDGAVERGRYPLSATRIVVVASGRGETDSGKPVPMTFNYLAEFRDDVWVVDPPGSQSGSCLSGGGSGEVFAWVAQEPTWTIQFKEAAFVNPGSDPDWVTLEGEGGVAWVEGELPYGHTRALDENGLVVACSWTGHLGPGEEWSPWTDPDADWHLPITVTPTTGLADGASVTVSGQGFPPNSNLEVATCRVDDSDRPDISYCHSSEHPNAAFVRTGSDGRFMTTFTVTAVFADGWEEPVDCHSDRCAVLVWHPVSGYIRAGHVPITFADG